MGLYSIYGYSDEESEKEAKVKISSISSFFLKAKKRPFLYSKSSTEMVFFNEVFQTVRLSKWYLHFDTLSKKALY